MGGVQREAHLLFFSYLNVHQLFRFLSLCGCVASTLHHHNKQLFSPLLFTKTSIKPPPQTAVHWYCTVPSQMAIKIDSKTFYV